MRYAVDLLREVNFAPESETEEILQNVRTILATQVGEVPLDRAFGVDWEALDQPLPVARALMQSAIADAIEEYEPRAKVLSVGFDDTADDAMEGITRPHVIVSIGDEEDEEDEL
ncbi:MAG: GPW/gp25 family protein, partial [Sutterella sp.]